MISCVVRHERCGQFWTIGCLATEWLAGRGIFHTTIGVGGQNIGQINVGKTIGVGDGEGRGEGVR